MEKSFSFSPLCLEVVNIFAVFTLNSDGDEPRQSLHLLLFTCSRDPSTVSCFGFW